MTTNKKLIAVIVILAILAAALGSWAVVINTELKTVKAQLAQALESQSQAAEEPTTAVGTTTENAGDAAAEFDGGIVTVAEAREEYGAIATYYYGMGETEDEFSDDLKKTVLQTLAETKILRAKAEALNLTELSQERLAELETQVKAEYEDNIAYYAQFRYDETKTEDQIRNETIEYLSQSGLSYEEMLNDAKEGAWRDALYEYATKDAQISDETLKEYYETQVVSDEMTYSVSFAEYEADADAGRAMAWNPAGVRKVDTILIPFDDAQLALYINTQAELEAGNTEHLDDLEALYAEVEPIGEEVANRLKNGESFETLRNEYGTLGVNGSYVSSESSAYGDDFKDAAMALQAIGDVSSPVRVDRGIVIVRYAEDVPEGTVAYEDIRDQLRDSYSQMYKQDVYGSFVQKCLEEANIRYYPERI